MEKLIPKKYIIVGLEKGKTRTCKNMYRVMENKIK